LPKVPLSKGGSATGAGVVWPGRKAKCKVGLLVVETPRIEARLSRIPRTIPTQLATAVASCCPL